MANDTLDEVRADVAKSVQELRVTVNDVELSDAELGQFREQAAQHGQRLEWGPAVGNGAAILALAGIVGNVPNPDVALNGLTWPLAMFSGGLAAGVLGVFLKVQVLEEISWIPRQLRFTKAKTMSVLEEVDRRVAALTPENAGEVIDAVKNLSTRLEPHHEKFTSIERRTKRLVWISHASTLANAIAVGTIALGFAALLIGHTTGYIRLER